MSARTVVPDLMPTLSAGRHRSPRRGACFMEFASYLAGERWSDHPRCTDPTLAALARAVNDTMHDARRGELVSDIPRVIGLRGDDSNHRSYSPGSLASAPFTACDQPVSLRVRVACDMFGLNLRSSHHESAKRCGSG